MEDSLTFQMSVSTRTGTIGSKSEKRNSHSEELLSLRDKEHVNEQCSTYIGNETQKNNKQHSKLQVDRDPSSKSMFHESNGKDGCQQYALLCDHNVSNTVSS
jgi:hypothetical protein